MCLADTHTHLDLARCNSAHAPVPQTKGARAGNQIAALVFWLIDNAPNQATAYNMKIT